MTLQKVSPNNSSAKRSLPLSLGQGRLKERQPVAVIDIGSNSVRQVIYEGQTRSPAVLFNEKVLCGLGEGLAASGKLNELAVERALAALRRFVALQEQANVADVHIIATAAARDASNGPEFIKRGEEIAGTAIEVLTGAMEAHYSALGIKSGFYMPSGIVGDMGGGSLELVEVNHEPGAGITLPLGGLRLRDLAAGSPEAGEKIARQTLRKVTIDWPGREKNFYAVGGTWRSLGKLHMANHRYPLPVVHDYQVDARELERFCSRLIDGDLDSFKGMSAVSKNRRELLPYGAAVLREIILHFKPEKIRFSSVGVREGLLYSRLTEAEQKRDSLLESAHDLSILRARAPEHSVELAEWTENAFRKLGIEESEAEQRFRIAACYLADVGWRSHPDFRARQAIEVISNAGFVGIDHAGRGYLAAVSFHRYQGLGSKAQPPEICTLAPEPLYKKARILSAFFRVLYLFSASLPGIIPKLDLDVRNDGSLAFNLTGQWSDLDGERPRQRIKQLGKELNREIELVVS